jgi:hypothetical protein
MQSVATLAGPFRANNRAFPAPAFIHNGVVSGRRNGSGPETRLQAGGRRGLAHLEARQRAADPTALYLKGLT